MNWKLDFDYWDPYKEQREAKQIGSREKSTNKELRINSNEKKMNRIVFVSSSKEKKKEAELRTISKERKVKDENPYFHVIDSNYFAEKEDNRRHPPSYPSYSNKLIEISTQPSETTSRKSPIKVIKKSPPKLIFPPRENVINTIVEAPSSIASSILNNFENHPERLLNNTTDEKLDRIFNL